MSATASATGERPEEPRISAIIPNFNHGHVIRTAVTALLTQSMQPIEVVIVDDGSTDNSTIVVGELAAADSRIKVVLHECNEGAIAALNSGIRAATGAYIYLGAADDVPRPHLLATLYETLASHPGAAFASGEVLLVDLDRWTTAVRPPARPSHHATFFDPGATRRLFERNDNFILTGAALIRRSCLAKSGGLRQDLDAFADGFLMRQLAFRHGFVFVPKVLAEWHVNLGGLSRSTASDAGKTLALLDAAATAFAEEPAFPPEYWPRFRRRWGYAVLRLALLDANPAKDTMTEFAPGPRPASQLFVRLSGLGWGGRLVCFVWATLWFRPISLSAVGRTFLARFLERQFDRIRR